MLRAFTLISLTGCIISGSALYLRSNDTASLKQKVENLKKEREESIDHTKLLRMKWSVLNHPERLARLSHKFLPALRPSDAIQYASLNSQDLNRITGANVATDDALEVATRALRTPAYTVKIAQASAHGHKVHAQILSNYHSHLQHTVKVPAPTDVTLTSSEFHKKAKLIKLASYTAGSSLALAAPKAFE